MRVAARASSVAAMVSMIMHRFGSEELKRDVLPRVINGETKERMREVLRDIQTGKFARNWIEENETGKKAYQAMYDADLERPIEKVGARLRQVDLGTRAHLHERLDLGRRLEPVVVEEVGRLYGYDHLPLPFGWFAVAMSDEIAPGGRQAGRRRH